MSAIARDERPAPVVPDPVNLAPRQNLTHRVLAGIYHKGGRVATDTSEMAAARGQMSAIQRQHRVQRRHGEEPSQTPTMSGLLSQQQPGDAEDDLPPSTQPRAVTPSAAGDDDNNQQATQPQLPRLGRIPTRSPPSLSSSPRSRGRPRGRSRGRPRGRPRLSRNPVGRPTGYRSAAAPPAISTSPVHGFQGMTKRRHFWMKILRLRESSMRHLPRRR